MYEPSRLESFAARWLPALEEEMRAVLAGKAAALAAHYGMIHYHMGWVDEAFAPGQYANGKRIRPLLCLMACEAVGGEVQDALSAAAAIEILHNFSLIHDDIEDGDTTRRHRPTLWALWGVAQAINAGDAMFALAYAALLRSVERGVSPRCTVAALQRFTDACIALTEGQHLDLRFEERPHVAVDEYLRMIEGKTASLMAASLSIGALIGGAGERVDEALHRFGHNIGLAFQIRDDILGIWGDPDMMGKATGNDVLRRKKSLPLLYALSHPETGGRLREYWSQGVTAEDLPAVMALLDQAGARAWAEQKLYRFHRDGLAALEEALGVWASNSPLMTLADGLLERQA